MEKGKRLLTLILCTALAVSAFAGCQKKQEGESAGSGEASFGPEASAGPEEIKSPAADVSVKPGGYVEEEVAFAPVPRGNKEKAVFSIFLGGDEYWKVYTAKRETTDKGITYEGISLYRMPFSGRVGEKKAEWEKEPAAGWMEQAISSH